MPVRKVPPVAGMRWSRSAAARRGLERHQGDGEQDQDRDGGVEHAARQLEQEDAAHERADRRAARERQDPPTLPAQLAPVAPGSADAAEHEADGVGDVGDHGRVADREQRREGDERARADDRVDRPRDHAGPRHGEHLEERHPPEARFSSRSARAAAEARRGARRERADHAAASCTAPPIAIGDHRPRRGASRRRGRPTRVPVARRSAAISLLLESEGDLRPKGAGIARPARVRVNGWRGKTR